MAQFFGTEDIKKLIKTSQTTVEWEAGSNLRIGGQAYNVNSALTLDITTDTDVQTTAINILKTLNSPNENINDFFGYSVAINGDYIVVGAQNDGGSTDSISGAGEAYVFKKDEGGTDNWGLIKTLNSPNESDGDQFGYSVAIDGDYIIVGAAFDDGSTDSISNAGEAYVFKKDQGGVDNWGLIKTLNPPIESTNFFGWSVAINGDYIVVGATKNGGSTDSIDNAGEAYVFKKDQGGVDNWGLIKTLNSPNESLGDEFGYSVAIDGDYIVVDAVGDGGSTDSISGAGEAYVFKKDQGGTDNWGLIKTLNSPNESDGDAFGASVAINGDYIVVGARGDDGSTDSISNAGEAYVFKKDQGGVDNWGLIKTLNSPNEDIDDRFGWSVAINGDYIVVGAILDDGAGDSIDNTGEAYVFKKDQGGVDNWGLIKTLNSPNESILDQFGYSVAIDGDYIIVGARLDDGSTDSIDNTGEAYVFSFQSAVEVQPDTIYYVYSTVIGTTVDLIYSLSDSAPAGYSAYRLIGSFGTNDISEISGTSNKDQGKVGDIIHSMLTEEQFIAENGAGWVLADGRDVTGSKYDTLILGGLGGNIPDARGQFLRGLDTSGVVDPDGAGRVIGDSQTDAFQNHKHEITLYTGTAVFGAKNGDNFIGGYSNEAGMRDVLPHTTFGTPRVSNETRPKNVAVNIFIKIEDIAV